jgi:hypothetical protein
MKTNYGATTKSMVYLELIHLNIHKIKNKKGNKYIKIKKTLFALLWLLSGFSFWYVYCNYIFVYLYSLIDSKDSEELKMINILDNIKKYLIKEKKAKIALPFLVYISQVLNIEEKVKERLK